MVKWMVGIQLQSTRHKVNRRWSANGKWYVCYADCFRALDLLMLALFMLD